MPCRATTSSWPLRRACSAFTGGMTTSWTCLISSSDSPWFFSQVSSAASRLAPRGVDADLLADQVAGGPDRTVLLGVVADEGLVVGAVVVDDRLDRRAGFGELDDRAGEGAAEVGLVGGGGLDVLRAADRVADPLQLDRAEVAQVLGELGQRHGVRAALVAQFEFFGLPGGPVAVADAQPDSSTAATAKRGKVFFTVGLFRLGSRHDATTGRGRPAGSPVGIRQLFAAAGEGGQLCEFLK